MASRRFLVALALSPFLVSCNPNPGPLTEAERDALRDTIVDRMNAYRDAAQTMDPEVVADLYSESPDFLVYSDGVSTNRQTLLEAYGAMKQTLERFEADWDGIEVTPLGRDAALASARFHRVLTDSLGAATRDWGTVTWVWVREGTRWVLIHGQAVHYPEADG